MLQHIPYPVEIIFILLALLFVALWLAAAVTMVVETVRKAGVRKRSIQVILDHISMFLPQGDKGKYLELSLALCLLLDVDTLSEITQARKNTDLSPETGRAVFRQIIAALDATSPHWYFKLTSQGKSDLRAMHDLAERPEFAIGEECVSHA